MAHNEDVNSLVFTEELEREQEKGLLFLSNLEVERALEKTRERLQAQNRGEDVVMTPIFNTTLDYLKNILQNRASIGQGTFESLREELEKLEMEMENGQETGELHPFEVAAIINLGDAFDVEDPDTLIELVPSLQRFSQRGMMEILTILNKALGADDEVMGVE